MDLKTRKRKQSYTISDIYRAYCQNVDEEVPYFRFKRILDEFNKTVRESVLEASESFKMPLGLGTICIVKYKPKTYTDKSLSVDYKASKEEGKRIYHLNEHSRGYKYRLYWSKTPQTFPHRYRYQLCLVRENKRHLAQLIFNNQDYINIDDIQIYKM
jgi:hypothetical protein